jgi:predicted RNase H-like nuclease
LDFIGVDGCRAGWFWIGLDASGRHEIGIARTTEALAAIAQRAKLVLIDIPIGLRDEGAKERLCDLEARRVLGAPRGSSVFPAPTRPALAEPSYEAACETNARLSGRRLSRQSFGIAQKIRSIDELLRFRADLRPIIRECHPEVCFWSLNRSSPLPPGEGKGEGKPMSQNKKRKTGRAERLDVLKQFFPEAQSVIEAAAKCYRRKDVAWDDIIDALALAVTARLGHSRLRSLPMKPERDSFDLPMEIVFAS